MMAILSLALPVILEVLKLFFSKDTTEETRKKAADDLLAKIAEINLALKKAEDTEGDTSDLEKVVNRPRK